MSEGCGRGPGLTTGEGVREAEERSERASERVREILSRMKIKEQTDGKVSERRHGGNIEEARKDRWYFYTRFSVFISSCYSIIFLFLLFGVF
jgi:hypothetical protein